MGGNEYYYFDGGKKYVLNQKTNEWFEEVEQEMAASDRYWDKIKGEWAMGLATDPVAHRPYDPRDDSWGTAYRKINEDTRKEKLEAAKENDNPYLTLKVDANISQTKFDEPFIINSYKQIDYKYNEAKYLGELRAYIDSTYDQHYSQNQFQATEFIIDGGHGTGFCIGNVLKYAQRYGRKGTPADWRKDLMKVIHYAVIQLHVHDLENSNGDKTNE